jgi:hypothetical protein
VDGRLGSTADNRRVRLLSVRCARVEQSRRKVVDQLPGSGGSIPLLHTLQTVAPNAEFILWGAEDTAKARIHASDESVDPAEIEAMILAQVILLQELAK